MPDCFSDDEAIDYPKELTVMRERAEKAECSYSGMVSLEIDLRNEIEHLKCELLAKEIGVGKTVVASEDFMRVEVELTAARAKIAEIEGKTKKLSDLHLERTLFTTGLINERDALKSHVSQLEATVAGMRESIVFLLSQMEITWKILPDEPVGETLKNAHCGFAAAKVKAKQALSTALTDYERKVQGLVIAIEKIEKKVPEKVSVSEAADMAIEFKQVASQALAEFRGEK